MSNPLPTTKAAIELAIRSAIVAEMEAIDEGATVRTRVQPIPYHVEGETEWLKVAGVQRAGIPETRVVFISFVGFGEEPEGKCDDTQLTLSYEFDVYFSQVNKRKDGSNSHDDFVSYLMNASQRFEENRSFGYAKGTVEHELLQTSEKAGVVKTKFGVSAHNTVLRLDVVIDL